MVDIKKKIVEKINDIDLMLNDLDISKTAETKTDEANPKLDIKKLDVIEVIDNILS
ncbi:MAG: hypothetical protein V3U89_08870 [Methylophilaceae bacterium]